MRQVLKINMFKQTGLLSSPFRQPTWPTQAADSKPWPTKSAFWKSAGWC